MSKSFAVVSADGRTLSGVATEELVHASLNERTGTGLVLAVKDSGAWHLLPECSQDARARVVYVEEV